MLYPPVWTLIRMVCGMTSRMSLIHLIRVFMLIAFPDSFPLQMSRSWAALIVLRFALITVTEMSPLICFPLFLIFFFLLLQPSSPLRFAFYNDMPLQWFATIMIFFVTFLGLSDFDFGQFFFWICDRGAVGQDVCFCGLRESHNILC